MLELLSDGCKQARERLRGQVVLDEDNTSEAMEMVRSSLLDADVEYGVTRDFVQRVKSKIVGQKVALKAGKGAQKVRVSPADHFVKTCQVELEKLMGPADPELVYAANRPTVVMMVGLQGSGKTTSTGKLTKYLMDRKGRKPLLVAADIYRPAAVQQLRILGDKVGAPVYYREGGNPVELCQEGIKKAFELGRDTVLIDTAGRLTIDSELMNELSRIKEACRPDNILLVCDAMMGQDAVTTAVSFHERLRLSGFIMTKLDGDARGGAALSIKEVTGVPIKFLGMGETLDQLEEFRPEGLASRILGLGDVVGLMQDFERVGSDAKEEDTLRMLQGQFTFRDFYEQIAMIQKMGSLKDLAAKLPMQGMIPQGANFDDSQLTQIRAMIDSMTEEERIKPEVFNPRRVQRIARGSGRKEKDVSELLQKFRGMRKMMGMMGKNMGLLGKIPGMGGLAQLGKLKKMAQQMTGGGGPAGGDPAGLMGGMSSLFGGGPGEYAIKKPIDRDKQRKMRKAAKQARKKNRKR